MNRGSQLQEPDALFRPALIELLQHEAAGFDFRIPRRTYHIAELASVLSAGGQITAASVAERYGVSDRTAQRYLGEIHMWLFPLTRCGWTWRMA